MKTKMLLCAASLMTLGACGYEAGSQIDEGGFGNPTMNNTIAQSAAQCVGRAKGYIVPDPIVVRDPNSSSDVPRYRHAQVRCLNGLNGKYAELIFGGYVESAEEMHSIQEITVEGGDGG